MKRPRKTESGFFNEMDITHAMRGWTFEPGQVNVRLIRGNDGKAKLQLRLDLGLLQMELEGRPDGKRPHRVATELDFQKKKLATHMKKAGEKAEYTLEPRDCQALREESAMFYHRYLSMFVLEQYESVIRDTQHNLDVLDLCKKYGKSEFDRGCLEQYRPYILMMNTRAKACEALRQGYLKTAVAYLHGGIKWIAHLFPKEQRRKMLRHSSEAHILLEMLRQIRRQLPPDPKVVLGKQLKTALLKEQYEEAAKLRDQLALLELERATAPETKVVLKHAREKEPQTLPVVDGVEPKAKKTPRPRRKKKDSGDSIG